MAEEFYSLQKSRGLPVLQLRMLQVLLRSPDAHVQKMTVGDMQDTVNAVLP